MRPAHKVPQSTSVRPPVPPEPHRYLRRALSQLRWATVAALLVLTIGQPTTGRFGLSTWAILLLFAGFSVLREMLLNRLSTSRALVWGAIVDLAAAAAVYVLGAHPGGALFILFVLAVVCAAAGLSMRATLLYTTAAAAIIAVIEPTLPLWSPAAGPRQELGARVVGLAVVGVGMTILARRLTLEQEATRASRGEAERLAGLDRLRADFLATVSHDLQTPLAATRVSLDVLDASAGGQLQPEERELLTSARRNNQRLGLLIADLLALNQIDAGTLMLDRQPVDLRAVVTGSTSTVEPLLKDKGQILEVDLPDSPLPINGDVRRLEQAVVSLLHNAHRHTPPSTHIMVVGRAAADEVLLSVRDYGPGIAAEDLEGVFRRFHQLSESSEGAGLGLTIARGVVELHGGRLWADSVPGQGAVFHIALPRAGGDEAGR